MTENQTLPMVSVIIPVYNDTQRLLTCIKALSDQTYRKDLYEIIVVDNGSDEDIEFLLHQVNNVVFSQESKVGAFPARNKGIMISKGDIIAFTDSDCIPDRNWIEQGVRSLLSSTDCGLVAGKIDIFYKSRCPSAIELYDGLTALPQKKFLENDHYGATANLFVPRNVFEKLGLFSDVFITEGGDAEFGHRVMKAGFRQHFCPQAIVMHPARDTIKAVMHKALRATIGTQQTIEKYNYHGWSTFRYVYVQLLKRPSKLNLTMSKWQYSPSRQKRVQVILLYFIIKIAQIMERVRVRVIGNTIR